MKSCGAACPHRELIEEARAACLACDHIEPAGHGGTISIEAAGERIVAKERLYIDRSPRGRVTNLSGKVEDSVAELLRRWVGMDPLELLLLRHMATGESANTFGDYLLRLAEAIEKANPLRENYRQTAWAKFQSLKRRLPWADKLRSWQAGHGGGGRPPRKKPGHEAN